ncbi:ABC transporter substrate-binding protein [Natronomonas sp. EA1]|uniref:ABC transporter substrate-binding protein n=1 Tax=Natronomonas sp. EA1 TaxID=3421655 RepID=UPI003EB6CEC6
MADDANRRTAPTRRDYMKYGGAVVGGGLLAGCTGQSDSGSTPEATPTESETSSETTTPEDSSYTASISPVGEVTFEAVPTNVMAYSPQYADMLVGLGHAESLNSLGFAEDYGTSLNYFLEEFDASIDTSGLTQLFSNGSFDKEVLYELDSDVHLQDPAWLSTFDGWSKEDTQEITEEVGPFFANRYSRQHAQPPKGWRDGYRYYTLWEISERVSQVFQEGERFAALKQEYEKLYSHIRTNLPPKADRPTVGLVSYWDGEFYPYRMNGPGFGKAHTRPMGVQDVFADSDRTYAENYGASYSFEGMLEADPDVILHIFAVTPWYDWDEIPQTLRDDPLGQKLTAIQNDRLYASGTSFQGPLTNLLQLEMTAKQLYPEQFGEWPGYEEGDSYPAFSKDEQLFDHARVADIVNGEL